MARYGKIKTRLWTHSQKWAALGGYDQARLLYLYLHTSPHRNSIGTYVLPEPYACSDLRWNQEVYRKSIQRLVEVGLVVYDAKESVVHITGAILQDPPTNKKHAEGMKASWEELPEGPCKEACWNELSSAKHFHDDSLF